MEKSNLVLATVSFVVFSLFFSCARHRNALTTLDSPDGNIRVVFMLKESADGSSFPCYSVSYKGKILLGESELGIEFIETGLLKNGLQLKDVTFNSKDETYPVNFGKSSTARDHYREAVIALEERKATKRNLELVFRAYDDGVAFRYRFPQQAGLSDFTITAEHSLFSFDGNPRTYALPLESFTTSYEANYRIGPLDNLPPDSLFGIPLLLEFPEGPWAALTEADLTDYAGMYLTTVPGRPGTLVSTLSPWPDRPEVKVKASTPHASPWRVLMIAENPGGLIQSNIILNLNAPCAIPDLSWIKTGKSAFLWWNDFVVTDVGFKGGLNTETLKYYIDFCSENGLEFFDLDTDEKTDWYGSREDLNSDITTSIPEIDIGEVLRYAREKGVGVRLWLPWFFVRDQMEKAFPVYEKWGVTGLKIDYMDRDDQKMVNFYHKVVKKAAKHHLTVNFHGAYKPTGIRRTYPNLITREGVLGLEYCKWSRMCNPEHDLMIPFTRMLAGPMDFTPGAFRTVTREEFVPSFHAPAAMGTRCHQLAMYVVYESPLQMVSDYPSAYLNQTGFEFLKAVPTTWDKTIVLNARPGDYVTIARQHGKEWYVGSMTDWTARELRVPLGFLPEGEFAAEIYADTPEADRLPRQVTFSKFSVTASDTLAARMAPGGGQAVRLAPASSGSSLPRYNSRTRE
ncbi:MAG TPA: glycoside hydrolase family 97 protein [archaeon]|nr:glycoside hydrolase family 97 protein [archaeon]